MRTSETPAAPPAASADHPAPARPAAQAGGGYAPLPLPGARGPLATGVSYVNKVLAIGIVELQKLRHDQWDVITRSIQPVLWLLLFGSVFTRLRVLPADSGMRSYLDFVAPGILAQSVMTIAIFQGIMLIWERDQGTLQKYMVSPMPRSALVLGKGLGSATKGIVQAFTISLLAVLMGVHLSLNPLAWLGVVLVVLLGANFFSTLSLIIAALVGSRERVQGLGQIILMPLFFASNALYPLGVMPDWVAVVSQVNPLSYMVDALRTLMIDAAPSHFGLGLDFLVLFLTNVAITALASRLYSRVVR
jgi:ABC-2 type transport system permease protein